MKFIAKKTNMVGNETKEEMTIDDISKLNVSGGVMMMIKRLKIGEKIFYNEINIEFERIE